MKSQRVNLTVIVIYASALPRDNNMNGDSLVLRKRYAYRSGWFKSLERRKRCLDTPHSRKIWPGPTLPKWRKLIYFLDFNRIYPINTSTPEDTLGDGITAMVEQHIRTTRSWSGHDGFRHYRTADRIAVLRQVTRRTQSVSWSTQSFFSRRPHNGKSPKGVLTWNVLSLERRQALMREVEWRFFKGHIFFIWWHGRSGWFPVGRFKVTVQKDEVDKMRTTNAIIKIGNSFFRRALRRPFIWPSKCQQLGRKAPRTPKNDLPIITKK